MQTSKTIISIVTPSLNQGHYIEEMIQSVLAQNYKNFEHIIIDGGSNDNTLDILKQYPHLIWVSEPDEGQSDALNKGFEKAQSEWVLWLNADDLLYPHALQRYSQEIKNPGDINVMHGHMHFFLNKSNKNFKKQYFNSFSRLKAIFGVIVPPTSGSLFKTKILKDNPLDKNYHYMMDWEWFIRCSHILNVQTINDFFVRFRVSGSNKTAVHLLTGKSNQQQQIEGQLLHSKYVMPIIAIAPKIMQKSYGDSIHYYLLFLNRIQKLRFYF